jgi:hypothetical protein
MDLSHSLPPTALLLLAGLGHALLWIGLVNRLDAVGVQWKLVKTSTAFCFLCMAALPAAWFTWAVGQREPFRPAWHAIPESRAVQAYLAVCCIVTLVTLIRWACLRLGPSPSVVRFCRRRRLPMGSNPPADANATPADANGDHYLFARLPGNETLQLELSEWILDVPRLDAALDGLSIVHLSDLHFTGWIGKSYFYEVMCRSNELQPDLVAITGDLADNAARLDWAADILGRLSARYGVYFVLGNHDVRVDADRLRRSLSERGLIDLGGRWMKVDVRERPVILAGNELPWIGPAANLDACPPEGDSPIFVKRKLGQSPGYPPACSLADPLKGDSPIFVGQKSGQSPEGRPLRIALTHTPDQFRWARAHGVDLLLAGHTHGGQIRIPPLGAIFSPTVSGVKHVSGVFYREPTILHVTRGVSGSVPFRWNCPPELALLRLRAKRAGQDAYGGGKRR